MKLVLFDIGNTRLKWATADRGDLDQFGVFDSHSAEELPEPPAAIKNHLADPHTEVWFCTVGSSQMEHQVRSAWFGCVDEDRIHHAEVSKKLGGFSNDYQNLDRLGVDRWVACLGARQLKAEGDLIVLDAGTAITIDWLDQDNCFQGGVILPGHRLMHDSLVSNTEGIKSTLNPSERIIGKTTSECVNSGVSFGLVGAVERVVADMSKHISRPITLIGCGGALEQLKSAQFGMEFVSDPLLVLRGLMAYASIVHSSKTSSL